MRNLVCSISAGVRVQWRRVVSNTVTSCPAGVLRPTWPIVTCWSTNVAGRRRPCHLVNPSRTCFYVYIVISWRNCGRTVTDWCLTDARTSLYRLSPLQAPLQLISCSLTPKYLLYMHRFMTIVVIMVARSKYTVTFAPVLSSYFFITTLIS